MTLKKQSRKIYLEDQFISCLFIEFFDVYSNKNAKSIHRWVNNWLLLHISVLRTAFRKWWEKRLLFSCICRTLWCFRISKYLANHNSMIKICHSIWHISIIKSFGFYEFRLPFISNNHTRCFCLKQSIILFSNGLCHVF